MKIKKYLTIEEQIALLKNKNLIIKSEKLAIRYLKEIGYYNLINGYKEPFIITNDKGQGIYKNHTSIDDLYNLYRFDHDLKMLILKHTLHIETAIKAAMSDVLSSKYGIDHRYYLNAANFKPDTNLAQKPFDDIKADIYSTIKKKKRVHKALSWYNKNYKFYPFWVLSNVITFGTVGLLYSKMKQNDQFDIAKRFNVKSKFLESALKILILFRNCCAHDEILYNFSLESSLSQKEIVGVYEFLQINKNPVTNKYLYGVNDFFTIFIIFKMLLSNADFNEFINQFNSLLNNLKNKMSSDAYSIIEQQLHIPKNYKDIKFYKNKH